MSTDSNSGGDALADGQTLKMTPDQMQALLAAGAQGVTRELRGWQPPSVEDLQVMLPQYEITAFIARGGMGAVYKGMQRALERTVAIKILPPDLVDDGESNYAERFKQEARAMAKFKHPGIVTVHDAGETTEGLLYFVMEFIEGTDVAHLVSARGQLPPEEAIRITTAVCDALAYAHARGVVHRDIKPSNIMIDADGQVKVADFGLAKITTHESGGLTKSSVTMGTPDFVAPEAMLAGALVDQRADLYAVGVMLYQMLTGQVPRGRFSPISAVVPKSDPKLDAIVDKAMQTDREKRYSTATEMKSDVEAVAMVGRSQPPSSDKQASADRRSWMMPALAAAVISGAGALVFFKDKPVSLPVEAAAPTAPWHLPDGEPGFVKEFAAEGDVRGLAMLPDGRRVVSKHNNIKRGNQTSTALIQWDVESGKLRWRREFPPFLSLDDSIVLLDGGTSMVVFQRHPAHALLVLDSRTGDTLHEIPIKGTPFYPKGPAVRTTMTASPDGTRLVLALYASTEGPYGPVYLQVFDAGLWAPAGQWTIGSNVSALYGVDWLDNQRVVVGVNEMDATARLRQAIVDVSHPGNKVQPVPWGAGFDHFFAVIPDQPDRMLAHSDGSLAIVDVKAGRIVKKWPRTSTQRRLLFLDAQNVLGLAAYAAQPDRLTIWNIDTGTEVWKLPDPRIHDQLVVSPDGHYAVTNTLTEDFTPAATHSSGKIAVWRLPPITVSTSAPPKTSAATGPAWPHLPTVAEKKLAFTNTLGMKFVPVPGTDALFCIHETRKRDYAAYAEANPGVDAAWRQPSFYRDTVVSPTPDHPVIRVSLNDAQGFCAWLTEKEGRKYRLPSDYEWSCAVGIGQREDREALPSDRGSRFIPDFAWGTDWPPSKGAGNIGDETLKRVTGQEPVITGYDDGFATTAPVMSFPPNALGIHDLAGNVWEWCPDWFDALKTHVVRRGSSYDNGHPAPLRAYVAACVRNPQLPDHRNENGGFRIVAEKP